MKNLTLLIINMMIFCNILLAQHSEVLKMHKEIAASNLSLSGANLIYKKQVKENVYRRWNFEFNRFYFSKVEPNRLVNFKFGLSGGKENRKKAFDRFSLIYGGQVGLSAYGLFSKTENQTMTYKNQTVRINPYYAYLFGAIYHIKPNFYIGVETLPSLAIELTYTKSNNNSPEKKFDFTGVDLYSNGYLGFTVGYQFR